tara:strand:+ start:119 stop:313 length:195 start_codon:yes stop_codon:yes gene_type:complete
MVDKGKKIFMPVAVMPQITLLLSQLLFLTALFSGFSLISGATFIAYERDLSSFYIEGSVFSLYD